MKAIRELNSSFKLTHLQSVGNENGKNENPENDNFTIDSGVSQNFLFEKECKDTEKTENYIFLLPPVILLLFILIMYALNKIFY